MAKKRMINADFLDNDVFMELPISARALYFHLLLRADDDGMVAKPKSIMREVQSSNDDLKALLDTRYILKFDSGVVCIKHWLIHNTIQKDRYKPTTYQDELSTLIIRSDKSYTEKERHKELVYEQSKDIDVKTDAMIRGSDFDIDQSWKVIVESYPKKRRGGSGDAKLIYIKKFEGAFYPKYVANLIGVAIQLYLKEYRESNGDEDYTYVKSIQRWFKEDLDYWMGKAEEYKRSKESKE